MTGPRDLPRNLPSDLPRQATCAADLNRVPAHRTPQPPTTVTLARRLLFPAEAPVTLEVFRIAVAAVLLFKGLALLPLVARLYGPTGLMPWAISDLQLGRYEPRLAWLAQLSAPLGLSALDTTWLVYGLYLLALLLLLLGLRARLAAVLTLLLHLCLVNSAPFTIYGVDMYAKLALFYLALAPLGRRLALDARRWAGQPLPAATYLIVRLAQLHLALSYFSAGYEKVRSADWRSGEVIWQAIQSPMLGAPAFGWLPGQMWVAWALAWGTMLLELGYLLLIWGRPLRWLWLAGIVGLHLGIAVVLGLHLFAALLIALNLSLFAAPQLLSVGQLLWDLARQRFVARRRRDRALHSRDGRSRHARTRRRLLP
jgi:Vitamin K-dependent gamma-carboxylase